jgi:hypothetical protein
VWCFIIIIISSTLVVSVAISFSYVSISAAAAAAAAVDDIYVCFSFFSSDGYGLTIYQSTVRRIAMSVYLCAGILGYRRNHT